MPTMLRVTFPDESQWDILAQPIAEDRARYYAARDAGVTEGDDYERVYREEVENALRDPDELIDWASNNMDWEDVQGDARQVRPSAITNYHQQWSNAKKRVVDIVD